MSKWRLMGTRIKRITHNQSLITNLGNYIPDGTKSICNFPSTAQNGFHWQKTQKTLLRDGLFQSLHATKPTQSLKLGLAFDLSRRHKSLWAFHPTRAITIKTMPKKHCSIKKKVFYCQRGFVFGCFFFARNRADRLLGRWRTGRQACLNGMALAFTAYSHSELIDGKVFLLFLFVPKGK